ncbi:UDP-N-acetylmuramoyl-tripeptide--D-alanyl-D-alanine ligase [Holosporaceae bacterium 'Namur']|nr:UDP-N-acetylmuramoyl-tripeptide--D-alanyl-D-alanine ligase [Holosporaceae bacterium 'Namur']
MNSSLADKAHENFLGEEKIIWNKTLLEQALGCEVKASFSACGVSINSRTIRRGEIFIAIKGENFDGNDFVLEALEKGAALVIISSINNNSLRNNKRVILVNNTMVALNKMAKFARSRLKGKVIGITGSVGKTSTKEMLKIALDNQGNVFATEGSYNNHIGLPLSLSKLPEDSDYAIIEMGMNHAGELADLTAIAIPDIAIITNVEAVHLEFFKSVSAIADAKSEIFNSMQAGGFAIINFDNPYHRILVSKAHNKQLNVVGFSETQKTPARLISYKLENGISHIKAELFGREYEYTINAPGKHLAYNSIAVLAATKIAGAEVECAAYNLSKFQSVKGRGEIRHLKKITVLDESYNASPVAVKAALSNLGNYQAKGIRLIAILGDMAELGVNSANFHKELVQDITKNKIDKVFTVGAYMNYLHEELPKELKEVHTDTSEQMAEIIKKYINEGDVILVKGRRTMKMENIIEVLVK